ncbi:MAG TPA: universal stress protein [Desulfuromonadales bacterium]|nr:universal stress protein [Desulfuromonadales bacterium]
MEAMKRILVVSRMTQNCQEAIEAGAQLAEKFSAKLFVMHVVHNPFGLQGWNLPMVSVEKEYQKLLEQTKHELEKLVKDVKSKGIDVIEVVRKGDPTDEILHMVKDENIDLLITLAHEEWRLEHFLFGRSNEELIRRMPCSVMFVKKEPAAVEW